jgi:hypothetical protein
MAQAPSFATKRPREAGDSLDKLWLVHGREVATPHLLSPIPHPHDGGRRFVNVGIQTGFGQGYKLVNLSQ